jgi:hypothetical protein
MDATQGLDAAVSRFEHPTERLRGPRGIEAEVCHHGRSLLQLALEVAPRESAAGPIEAGRERAALTGHKERSGRERLRAQGDEKSSARRLDPEHRLVGARMLLALEIIG